MTLSRAEPGFAEVGMRAVLFFLCWLGRVGGLDGDADSAAGCKLAVHGHGSGRAGGYQIIEDAICDFFVERTVVAVRGQIELE